MIIRTASHVDHGLPGAVVSHILARFADRAGFFVETITLPDSLPAVVCSLVGPTAGDEPVPEGEVTYLRRGDRAGASRMVARVPRLSRLVTVIAGPHEGHPCVLYTAHGGPAAPREPWDPTIPTDEARQESCAFWATHALTMPPVMEVTGAETPASIYGWRYETPQGTANAGGSGAPRTPGECIQAAALAVGGKPGRLVIFSDEALAVGVSSGLTTREGAQWLAEHASPT